MVTTYKALNDYCKENNLPAPSKNDLTELSRIISNQFRVHFAPSVFLIGSIIPDAGYTITVEDDKKICVNAYPDIFKEDMFKGFKLFYAKKAENVVKHAPKSDVPLGTSAVSHRKRKPYTKK